MEEIVFEEYEGLVLEKLTNIDETLQAIFILMLLVIIIYASKKIMNRLRGV